MPLLLRIDTPIEAAYFSAGGIMPHVRRETEMRPSVLGLITAAEEADVTSSMSSAVSANPSASKAFEDETSISE